MYYFDTNFFYYAHDDKSVLALIKSKFSTEDFKINLINILELLSHINLSEKEKFARYRDILGFAHDVTNGMLPYPETAIASVLGVTRDNQASIDLDMKWLDLVVKHVCQSPDFDALMTKKIVSIESKSFELEYKEDGASKIREKIEDDYISNMDHYVTAQINPLYQRSLAKGKTPKVRSKETREKICAFLETETHNFNLLLCTYVRASHDVISALEILKSDMAKVYLDKFSAYFEAYTSIIRKHVCDGYSFIKNKNDCNDIHLLAYLALFEDAVFVTSDKRLSNKVSLSPQCSRIITYEEFVARMRT